MAFPGNLTLITVTGTYLTNASVPCQGTVTFSLDHVLADSGGSVIIYPSDTTETLDVNGHLSVELPCTDNASVFPEPWTYRVTERITGRPPRVYSISLPSSMAPTVDLSELTPSQSINPVGVTITGTPTAGQVPTATGPSTADWQTPTSGVGDLVAANNLSDVESASTARTNLGLGGAAVLGVGASSGTVAAGNDTRITGAAQTANNLSDLQSPAVARTNLGLGSAATQASSAFDAAGAAASAESAAIASAADLYLPTPWLFSVAAAAYGAVGDGKLVTDGAMSSSVNPTELACATSTPFRLGDVGKLIMVKGAAPTGVTSLVTTIAGFIDSGHVTLASAASTSISGALVMWASDDTGAVQAAINAAVAYASAHGSATVFFPVGAGLFYGVGGALQAGGSTKGNAQLTLPIVAATGNKITLTFEGVGGGAGLQHWQQTVPQCNGSTIVSFGVFASTGAQTSAINACGTASVIGGPTTAGGYGISPGIFSNILPILKDLSILTTYSSYGLTYTPFDFFGCAEASLVNLAIGTTGTVPNGDFVAPGSFANGLAIGGAMPAPGNNDLCTISNLSIHGGFTYGLFATEHTTADRICILYCWSALCVVGNYAGSVGSTHAVSIQQLSVEGCTNEIYFLGAGSGGIGPFLHVGQLDTESGAPTFADNDGGTALAAALGTVRLTGLYTPSAVTATYPTGLKIINGQMAYQAAYVTANYSVSIIDDTILVDASAGNVTVTLISAAWTPNVYTIKRLDSSGNTVALATIDGQTIDGASTLTITGPWSKATVAPARVSGTWGWYTV